MAVQDTFEHEAIPQEVSLQSPLESCIASSCLRAPSASPNDALTQAIASTSAEPNKRRRYHNLAISTKNLSSQDTHSTMLTSGKKTFRMNRPSSIFTSLQVETHEDEEGFEIEVPTAPRNASASRQDLQFFPSPRSVLDRRSSSELSF